MSEENNTAIEFATKALEGIKEITDIRGTGDIWEEVNK
tara:strand:+ start:54079 stop:54192 length:114 start_codon:yes stop_codon:yes gene_type:complete